MSTESRPHITVQPRSEFSDRRRFLARAGLGFGALAAGALLAEEEGLAAVGPNPLAARPGHLPTRVRSVIWLFLNGGPSQVDTWDYKPELEKRHGQELQGFDKDTGFFVDQVGPLMKSPFRFERRGRCGKWVPEIFPRLGEHVDDMAFLHACHTETNNHSPALFQINTGQSRMGFPSVGAWVTYGLGTPCQNLPAFVVMYDTLGRGLPKGYAQNWGAGFLPGVYQGTALKPQGAPIDNLERAGTVGPEGQRAQLDLIRRLNERSLSRSGPDALLSARIESFELAYRMQMSAPEALDWSAEPEHIRRLYGIDSPRCGHFARQCLMARRMAERGVRFIQIYSGGEENEKSWDGHSNIEANHRQFAGETDQPIAALLADLKQRGMLESTLLVCCGEFGRLPIVQKGGTGRDHNPHAFTTWLAGGGVRGGVSYGETDEIGHKAAVNRVSVNDLHATILALAGMDHEKLTYFFNGRNYRLTDVAGIVARAVIA